MQIMEGDLIATIQENIQWISHFHTGGVPGRHELNDKQEVCWDGVMRGIAATGFDGYVAHEFLPTQDHYVSSRQAAELCGVCRGKVRNAPGSGIHSRDGRSPWGSLVGHVRQNNV